MASATQRKIQIFFAVALAFAGLRLAWVLYQRHESDKAANSATSAPARKLHSDDYVYLRPSHVYDLASTRKFLVGKTVWVKTGNAVAYFPFHGALGNKEAGALPPLAVITPADVVTEGGQMYAIFVFDPRYPTAPEHAACGTKNAHLACAVPIGTVKNGDYTIIIDDIFYFDDPHKLYPDWTKDQWDAIGRHEITKGMSEAMAQASMGLGHAPEGASSNSSDSNAYGNRTLVFTDPAHPDKPVTVRFVDNAAVSVSQQTSSR